MLIYRAGLLPLALAAAAQAGPALGQTADGPCELHVWASAGMGNTLHTAKDGLDTSYMGALGTSAGKRIETNTANVHTSLADPDGPLPNQRQLDVLRSLELGTILALPNHRLVFHELALDSLSLRSPSRYASQAADCYAELVVSDVVYSREYANGQNLKSFIRFRDFGTGQVPVRKLSTWAQTKLISPREGKKANVEASNLELPLAMAENVRKFAGYLGKTK